MPYRYGDFIDTATLPRDFDGDDRLSGSSAIGLPMSKGHYLALRDWQDTSFTGPYRAVFHRDPSDHWTIYTNVRPEAGCGRFWSSAVDELREVQIDVEASEGTHLSVSIPEVDFEWDMRFESTPSTSFMTVMAGMMPSRAWTSDPVLGMMSRFAGPVLGIGRIDMAGEMPNGQHYRMAPRAMWRVTAGRAHLGAIDLGEPAVLTDQIQLGDMWLPRRGLFAVGAVRSEPYDLTRHVPAHVTRGSDR
ncbi:MAG: hypothetical protein KDB69_05130 [Acidimicrobiia bacterium]|nr:hypothetical protein [Acidimicrobiia bacterium]